MEKPPAHWLLWSYLWRYTLLIVVPLSVGGMYLGMLESTGYAAHSDPEMVANIAMFGVMFGGLGQIVALGVALTLFIATTPARRQWAAHRDAGWTTMQCRAEYVRQKHEASARKLDTRLRGLKLPPVQRRSDVSPELAPAQDGSTRSARRREDPPGPMRGLTAIRKVAFIFAAVVMVCSVGGVLFSPLLDRIQVEASRCEVVSAEPSTSSGGSRGSASTASVLIETSNCGALAVSRGVTFDNQQEVAASFEQGSEYEFDMGWYSRVVMKRILNGVPTAADYRLVE